MSLKVTKKLTKKIVKTSSWELWTLTNDLQQSQKRSLEKNRWTQVRTAESMTLESDLVPSPRPQPWGWWVAKIWKITDVRICGDWNPHHCWGRWEYQMGHPLWKTGWQFFNKINRILIRPSNSAARDVPKGIENRDSNRYLHVHVHSSVIDSSPEVETTPVPQMNG